MSLVSGAVRLGGAGRITVHLLAGVTTALTVDEVAPTLSRGLVSEGLAAQLAELSAGANRARTDRPLWHVHCNPKWEHPRAVPLYYQRLEEEFELQVARFSGVMHTKGKRARHGHRVYDITHPDGRVTDLSFERMRRGKVVVLVAHELGLPLPPTPFRGPIAAALRREGKADIAAWVEAQPAKPRPTAAPTPGERQMVERTGGLSKADVARLAFEAWQHSDSGAALATALAASGLQLHAGTDVPVVRDAAGGTWSLTRLIGIASGAAGARIGARAVHARLADLTLTSTEDQRRGPKARRPSTAPTGARPPVDRRGPKDARGRNRDEGKGRGDPSPADPTRGRHVAIGGSLDGSGEDAREPHRSPARDPQPSRVDRDASRAARQAAEIASAAKSAQVAEAARLAKATADEAARMVAEESAHAAAVRIRQLRAEAARTTVAIASISRERHAVPSEIIQARVDARRLHIQATTSKAAKDAADAALVEIERARPPLSGMKGLWNRLNGRGRAYHVTLRTAKGEATRAAENDRAKQFMATGAATRLATAETAWKYAIATDQAERRRRLETRLNWLGEAVAAIERSPPLGMVSDVDLIEAVRRRRLIMDRMERRFTPRPEPP